MNKQQVLEHDRAVLMRNAKERLCDIIFEYADFNEKLSNYIGKQETLLMDCRIVMHDVIRYQSLWPIWDGKTEMERLIKAIDDMEAT